MAMIRISIQSRKTDSLEQVCKTLTAASQMCKMAVLGIFCFKKWASDLPAATCKLSDQFTRFAHTTGTKEIAAGSGCDSARAEMRVRARDIAWASDVSSMDVNCSDCVRNGWLMCGSERRGDDVSDFETGSKSGETWSGSRSATRRLS